LFKYNLQKARKSTVILASDGNPHSGKPGTDKCTMTYYDDNGEYILRKSFTTKSGKRVVAPAGSAFKIYISKNSIER